MFMNTEGDAIRSIISGFEDENGVPMVRECEPETGRTRFVEATEGITTYQYNKAEVDPNTGGHTTKATIMHRTIKMPMYKKQEQERMEMKNKKLLSRVLL